MGCLKVGRKLGVMNLALAAAERSLSTAMASHLARAGKIKKHNNQ